MAIIYLLKVLNWYFLITGNGSITFIGRKWMYSYVAWRSIIICVFIINAYNGNIWVLYI